MSTHKTGKRFYLARTKLNPNSQSNGKPESIQAVYRATSVPASSIVMYENGTRLPNMENARKLADYYGVNVSWLLGESESYSVDESNQTVSKLTGLSNDAICNLQTLKEWGLSEALSMILEVPDFIHVVERFEAGRLISRNSTESPEESLIDDQAYVYSIKDTDGKVSDFAILSKRTQSELLIASATQIFGSLIRDIIKEEANRQKEGGNDA